MKQRLNVKGKNIYVNSKDYLQVPVIQFYFLKEVRQKETLCTFFTLILTFLTEPAKCDMSSEETTLKI
jgi:hypothetical protein